MPDQFPGLPRLPGLRRPLAPRPSRKQPRPGVDVSTETFNRWLERSGIDSGTPHVGSETPAAAVQPSADSAAPDFVRSFVDSAQYAEGYFKPGSRPMRNNNPLDLKNWPGYPTDKDGYTIFPDYATGRKAGEQQVNDIFSGKSAHYTPGMTIREISRIWSPEGAEDWSRNVAHGLGVSEDVPLSALAGERIKAKAAEFKADPFDEWMTKAQNSLLSGKAPDFRESLRAALDTEIFKHSPTGQPAPDPGLKGFVEAIGRLFPSRRFKNYASPEQLVHELVMGQLRDYGISNPTPEQAGKMQGSVFRQIDADPVAKAELAHYQATLPAVLSTPAQRWYQTPLVWASDAAPTFFESHPVAKAVADMGSSLTTYDNALILGYSSLGGGFLGALGEAVPATATVARVANAGIAGYFTLGMLKGMAETAPEALAAYRRGDTSAADYLGSTAALNGMFAFLGLRDIINSVAPVRTPVRAGIPWIDEVSRQLENKPGLGDWARRVTGYADAMRWKRAPQTGSIADRLVSAKQDFDSLMRDARTRWETARKTLEPIQRQAEATAQRYELGEAGAAYRPDVSDLPMRPGYSEQWGPIPPDMVRDARTRFGRDREGFRSWVRESWQKLDDARRRMDEERQPKPKPEEPVPVPSGQAVFRGTELPAGLATPPGPLAVPASTGLTGREMRSREAVLQRARGEEQDRRAARALGAQAGAQLTDRATEMLREIREAETVPAPRAFEILRSSLLAASPELREALAARGVGAARPALPAGHEPAALPEDTERDNRITLAGVLLEHGDTQSRALADRLILDEADRTVANLFAVANPPATAPTFTPTPPEMPVSGPGRFQVVPTAEAVRSSGSERLRGPTTEEAARDQAFSAARLRADRLVSDWQTRMRQRGLLPALPAGAPGEPIPQRPFAFDEGVQATRGEAATGARNVARAKREVADANRSGDRTDGPTVALDPQSASTAEDELTIENQTLEALKPDLTPQELAAVNVAQDENRDAIAEARRVRERHEPTAPELRTVGGPVEAIRGTESDLITVNRRMRVVNAIVDANDLTGSHDPMTFAVNPSYPKNVQDRQYQHDATAQADISSRSQRFEPKFIFTDTAGPEHGPPVITADGIVLGGFSRFATMVGLLRKGAEEVVGTYLGELQTYASRIGIPTDEADEIGKLAANGGYFPIPVRIVIDDLADMADVRAIATELNKTFTRAMTHYENAIALGKRISPADLDFVAGILDSMGPEASLRDMLRESGRQVVDHLIASGVISPQERGSFVDPLTQGMTDQGKVLIEDAMLGSAITDPRVLSGAPASILLKVERSLPAIVKINARGGDWGLGHFLIEAVRQHALAKSKGVSVREQLDPSTGLLFGRDRVNRAVEVLARFLEGKQGEINDGFRRYAADAVQDVAGQGRMLLLAEPPKPWEAFSQSFKADPSIDAAEWARPAVEATEKVTERVASSVEPRRMSPVPGAPPTGAAYGVSYFLGDLQSAFEQATGKFLPEDQIGAIGALVEARAAARGVDPDEWVRQRFTAFPGARPGEGESTKSAITEFLEDGRAVITAFRTADLTSVAHELGHVFRRDLTPTELAEAERIIGRGNVVNGVWTVKAEEEFARRFERYLLDGQAPNATLEDVFGRFKVWLRTLYEAMKRILPPKIGATQRRFFDKMFGGESPMLRGAPGGAEEDPPGFVPTLPPEHDLRLSLQRLGDPTLEDLSEIASSGTLSADTPADARDALDGIVGAVRTEMDRRTLPTRPQPQVTDSVLHSQKDAESGAARLKQTPADKMAGPAAVKALEDWLGRMFEGVDPGGAAPSKLSQMAPGKRLLDQLTEAAVREFGPSVRPHVREAYLRMLRKGIDKLSVMLRGTLTEQQRALVNHALSRYEEAWREEASYGGVITTPERPEAAPSAPVGERAADIARAARTHARPPAAPGGPGTHPGGAEEVRPVGSRVGGGGRRVAGSAGRGGPAYGGYATGAAAVSSSGGGFVPASSRREKPIPIESKPWPTTGFVESPEVWKGRLIAGNVPDDLPPPTVGLPPEVASRLIFPGQEEMTQAALSSLQVRDGVLVSAATGAGKTYTGAGVVASLRPRRTLVLTPRPTVAKFLRVMNEFGLHAEDLPENFATQPGGLYVTTYDTAIRREGLGNVPWDLVILDEGQKARNWYASNAGGLVRQLNASAKKVLYMSATPYHTPLELGYLDKLGMWSTTGLRRWLSDNFGVRVNEDLRVETNPMNPVKMEKLANQMRQTGLLIPYERPMKGYTAAFGQVPFDQENMRTLANISRAFQLAQRYFQNVAPVLGITSRKLAAIYTKTYIERAKIPAAIDNAKRLLDAGWDVTVFTHFRSGRDEPYEFLTKPLTRGKRAYPSANDYYEGEIARLLPKLPDVVQAFKTQFGDQLADYTGSHSPSRERELADFMAGKKRLLITTYSAGGTGVDFDDKVGDRPRAAIFLSLPWDGMTLDQALGRYWRFGTRSNVYSLFLVSNTKAEADFVRRKIYPRFQSVRASIAGINKADPLLAGIGRVAGETEEAMAYAHGGKPGEPSVAEFQKRVDVPWIELHNRLPLPSAEDARHKGIPVQVKTAPPPLAEPSKLGQPSPPPPDLSLPEDARERTEALGLEVKPQFYAAGPLEDATPEQRSVGIAAANSGGKLPVINKEVPPPGTMPPDPSIERGPLTGKTPGGLRRQFGTAIYQLLDHPTLGGFARRLMKAYDDRVRWEAQTLAKLDGILGKMSHQRARLLDEILDTFEDPKDAFGEASKTQPSATFDSDITQRAVAARQLLEEIHVQIPKGIVRGGVGKISAYMPHMDRVRKYDSDLAEGIRQIWSYFMGRNLRAIADAFRGRAYRTQEEHLYPLYEPEPFSPFVLRREREDMPRERDGRIVLRAYVHSIARVIHDLPAVRDAERTLARSPDQIFVGDRKMPDVMKQQARWLLNNYRKYTNYTRATEEWDRGMDALARMVGNSILPFRPAIQSYYLGRFLLFSFERMPSKYWAYGIVKTMRDPMATYRKMGQLGMNGMGITPWRLKQLPEKLNSLSYFMGFGTLIDRGSTYWGLEKMYREQGLSPQEAEDKAIPETKRMTMMIDPVRAVRVAEEHWLGRLAFQWWPHPLKQWEEIASVAVHARQDPVRFLKFALAAYAMAAAGQYHLLGLAGWMAQPGGPVTGELTKVLNDAIGYQLKDGSRRHRWERAVLRLLRMGVPAGARTLPLPKYKRQRTAAPASSLPAY